MQGRERLRDRVKLGAGGGGAKRLIESRKELFARELGV